MKNFKVLLVYVNSMLDNMVAGNLSLISACIKEKGFEAALFDTTCYRTAEKSADQKRVENLQVRPFSFEEYGVKLKEADVYEDFYRKVIEFKPHLIGMSLVETTFDMGMDMLKKIKGLKIPNIIGGPHAILDLDGLIQNENVDMVCTCEGEELIGELCERMYESKDLNDIRGLCFKRDGKIMRNKKRPCLVDLDNIPYMDFSIYEKERFYKPMAGKIYKMVPVEMSRGCCYNCYSCCDEAFNKKFSDIGRWYRQKSIERIFSEIDYYISKFSAQYLYFVSETFLAMSEKRFHEFIERYRKIRLPFWFNTRPETITEDKIKLLEEAGCDRISIGVEHGNEEFRRNVLNRKYSNETVIKAVEILKRFNISITVNNIIGIPGEDRKLVFDTIDLNRRLNLRKRDSVSCFMLAPYKGTVMRDICVKKGYIDKEVNIKDPNIDYVLKNPMFKENELSGLMRTFAAYCRLPEQYFSLIQEAEKITEKGNVSFEKVRHVYSQIYF